MRMLFTCCKKVRRHREPLSNTHTHARQAGGHSTEVCPLYRQPAQAVSLSPHRACSQGECQSSHGAATQRQQECRCRLCASCAERTLLARASTSPPLVHLQARLKRCVAPPASTVCTAPPW